MNEFLSNLHQEFFRGLTPEVVVILIIFYLILYSNTLLGLIFRILACVFIYTEFKNYGTYQGIIVSIIFLWPAFLKYILKGINYVLNRVSGGGGSWQD